MGNLLENLVLIYSADEGKLKILLKKRLEEPYKNYWTIPGDMLDEKTTLEESTRDIFERETNVKVRSIIQGSVFSNLKRNRDARIIAFTNVVITDKDLVDMKKDNDLLEWFEVDSLPKLAFDHRDIIEKVTEDIKEKITLNYSDILLELFPSDFTLPDFQLFYENVIGKEIDRRNFRKKIFNQNLVIDTGFKSNKKMGRPSTLYRFNPDEIRGKRI
ncbi:MAG: NUDIX hydrolase [Bacilli bacterium]|nr:NUDIX hydrolase [Bacilli bacterium]